MLRSTRRSTRHAAVEPPPDSAHCPPDISTSFLYSPSTALSSPAPDNQAPLCHAGLCKARFSVKHQIINFNKLYSSRMGFLQKSQADQGSENSSYPSRIYGVFVFVNVNCRYMYYVYMYFNCSLNVMFTIRISFCIKARKVM